MAAFCKYAGESRIPFSPYHTGLIIGDVLLAWNPNSLVIPLVLCDYDDDAFMLAITVHDDSSQRGDATVLMPMQAEAECPHEVFEKQVQIVVEIGTEKQTLINALVGTAVAYNQKRTYRLLTNNCQHFVVDALNGIGIKHPVEAFRGKLKQRTEQRAKPVITEFDAHQELGLQQPLQQQREQSVQEQQEHQQQTHGPQQRLDAEVQQLRRTQQVASRHQKPWNLTRQEVQVLSEIGRGAWSTVARGKFRGQSVAVKWPHSAILNEHTID